MRRAGMCRVGICMYVYAKLVRIGLHHMLYKEDIKST
jgi:hypothetical protein